MPEHPSIENLHDDLAMASMQDPHQPGSPESNAYQDHLIQHSQPEHMHKYLGRGVEDIIAGASQHAQRVGDLARMNADYANTFGGADKDARRAERRGDF